MGLAVRIIPTILCKGRQMVKGEKFNAWRSVGLAAQAVRIHQGRGVDEIALLDIGATPENRLVDLKLVEELTANCFSPIAVGGGVRTLEDVRALLAAGADKAVLGTYAIPLVLPLAKVVGCQAIVVAIDVIEGTVAWNCGKAVARSLGPVEYAKQMQAEGAGEILLTSVDREGTMQGYDLNLIESVAKAVSIPVIAHGGCGSYEHMLQAVHAGASAVAAGAMFQFTEQTPRGAAEYLASHGIETRLQEEKA